MQKDSFIDLLSEYALEQLPEETRLRVKAHLDSGRVACNTELQILQETIHLLPLSLQGKKIASVFVAMEYVEGSARAPGLRMDETRSRPQKHPQSSGLQALLEEK